MSTSRDERLANANTLREGGELEQARRALLELRAEYPDDAHIAVQTAWVHDSLGYEEEAVPHYEAAIAGELSDDELRRALLGLGSTYRSWAGTPTRTGRYGGASSGSPNSGRCGCSTR